MRVTVALTAVALCSLVYQGCSGSSGGGGLSTAETPGNYFDGTSAVAVTSDSRGGVGFAGVSAVDADKVGDFDVKDVTILVRLNGRNSPQAVQGQGYTFSPRLHPSYGGGASNGRNKEYYKSLALQRVKDGIYGATTSIPNGGTFRFAVSLAGGPEAKDVTVWAEDFQFDSAYYEEGTDKGIEFYYIEADNRIYFRNTPASPPPAKAPNPPPPPPPPANFHFINLFNTTSGTKYLTYDLLISGIEQGDPSDPNATSHGLVFLELLGSVDGNNWRVKVYVFLGLGPMGEDNTPLPTDTPQLHRDYDSVAEVNRPSSHYDAINLMEVGDGIWMAEVNTFPANGKLFLNFTLRPGVFIRGLPFDSAHDESEQDKLGFWLDNGNFRSLHD